MLASRLNATIAFAVLVVSTIAFAAAPRGPAPQPASPSKDDPALRQKLKAWLDANLDRQPEIAAQINAQGDAGIKKGEDVVLNVEAENMKSRKSTAFFSYSGEFYSYLLSPTQAKEVGLYPGHISLDLFPSSSTSKRLPQPIFQIANIKIDNRLPVPGTQKITGSFTAKQINNSINFGRIVIRVGNRAGGTSRSLDFHDALPANGVVTFSLGPINDADHDPFFGPMPVFVDLMVTGIDDAGSIASNTLFTMVDILPDHDAVGKKVVELSKQLVAVLASIKDQASADQAVKDYTSIAVKNQSLVDLASRLPPLPPAQQKALDDKYNAEADQFAQKLQEQITRLQAADYAGEPLFDKIQKSVEAANKK